ncbi:MAG: hypothetical protein KGZ34_02520 [Nitrosarchaeum sp.]|nr:hypothetical protein [Nitrosarchaeum sp.]
MKTRLLITYFVLLLITPFTVWSYAETPEEYIAYDIDLTPYVIIGIFVSGGIGAGIVFLISRRK